MPIADFPKPWEILWRRYHHTTRSGDRFRNDRGYRARIFVDDEILDGIHAVDLAGGVSLAIVTAVAVWGRDSEGPRHERTIIRIDTLRRTADTHGSICRAMVGATAGNDFVALRFTAQRMILTRDFQGRLHGLRATTAEQYRGQVPRGQTCQQGRELNGRQRGGTASAGIR